jgi:hypothetical protein
LGELVRQLRPVAADSTITADGSSHARNRHRLRSAALSKAKETVAASCPKAAPLTPIGRLDAVQQRLDAMIQAVQIVRSPAGQFYGSLSDDQRQRFVAMNRLPEHCASTTTPDDAGWQQFSVYLHAAGGRLHKSTRAAHRAIGGPKSTATRCPQRAQEGRRCSSRATSPAILLSQARNGGTPLKPLLGIGPRTPRGQALDFLIRHCGSQQ